MTVSNALTQFKAKNLGPGKHFDGQGLMLVKNRKDHIDVSEKLR